MAKKQKPPVALADDALKNVSDYRFPESTRKNNPPAKIAAEGYVPLIPKAEYLYSPRRTPELRFDPTGRADELPELLAKATRQKLTQAEARALSESLRVHEPWLEWAGKQEAKSFAVDPVALHIHERVSEHDQTRAKHTAANRWVAAVNNWGQLRRWAFHVSGNPQLLDREMEYLARAEAVPSDLDRHRASREDTEDGSVAT